ncbi:MAG: hypothetical protein HKN73_11685 [Gemmatimonadetes bacterium]|nr:hypothetical protein [Gemmatimonadota bacterium]
MTVLCAALLVSCSPGTSEDAASASELTRRQKDSLVAEMPIPGAGAVGKALGALEASERRAAAHDSIS